jgi:hypothetical protein
MRTFLLFFQKQKAHPVGGAPFALHLEVMSGWLMTAVHFSLFVTNKIDVTGMNSNSTQCFEK